MKCNRNTKICKNTHRTIKVGTETLSLFIYCLTLAQSSMELIMYVTQAVSELPEGLLPQPPKYVINNTNTTTCWVYAFFFFNLLGGGAHLKRSEDHLQDLRIKCRSGLAANIPTIELFHQTAKIILRQDITSSPGWPGIHTQTHTDAHI